MTHPSTSTSLWMAVKNEFQKLFSSDVFQTWFAPLECLEETEDSVLLQAPNDFTAIWVQDNYLDVITKRLHMAAGRNIELNIVAQTEEPTPAAGDTRGLSQPCPTTFSAAPPKKQALSCDGQPYVLNPKNTFENFIVGAGSQLAHAASIAVANAPAQAYNPLFLYGETGLGKTHLMHAVAHHVMHTNTHAKVAYVSTEKFTNEFIRAIRNNTLIKFRQHYRNVDVLLIDDIHFLAGKERIQEEFFHTFNELFESQKQIFLCSDCPAGEIDKLEGRLVSRFQWGLVTDVQPPDFETRVAILTKKAAAMKLQLDPEILQFLAKRVSRNVRRLEGALTRVAGYAALVKKAIDVPAIERLLQDILQEEAQAQVTIDKVQRKVADYYHLRLSDMMSKRRPANIAFPRQIAMYLSRLLTSHSLQEIGDNFGGRDHGTVIHACKAVENMMDQDTSVKRVVEYLQTQMAKP